MAIKTQGTQLYFIDPANDSVVAVQCSTGITGFSSPRDQIETTCLESDSRSYEPGMRTPGAITLNLNFDPSSASHMRIHELYVSGERSVEFALGWSDGTDAPLVGESVQSVTITAGGTGYGSGTVTFSAPQVAGGVTATGTVTSVAGVITGVVITNPGSGYTSAPTVTFGGGGSGGTGTAVLTGVGEFVLPVTRTYSVFNGYFSDVPQEFALSAVVTAAVAIQISGDIEIVPKV